MAGRTEDASHALAALRILTGGVSLLLLPQLKPWDFVNDLGLNRRPFVGVWLVDLFPDDQLSLYLACAAFTAALVALTVGWHARTAAAACLVLGIWVWGLPQGLTGTVHINHLLVMYALLAAGPSDGVWALRPGRRDPDGAGVAMMFARVAIGVVYLFPGLAKLRMVPYWDDALERHMRLSQMLYAPVQWMPPDWVIDVMAVGAIVFEVGFLAAMFTRWRPVAAAVGIGFHLTTGVLLGIWFQGLWPLLIAFMLPQPDRPKPIWRWRYVPALGLIAGSFLMGLADNDRGWPVSQYPQFDHFPGKVERSELIATTEDGDRVRATSVLLPHHGPGFWAKLEHNHSEADIERAVEAKTGQDVTLRWVLQT